jgi:hypothetical protein
MRDAVGAFEKIEQQGEVMSWLRTVSGGRFDPLNPKVDEVKIGDIAHALSHLCRFAGHTRRFYSVGEHSWRVSAALAQDGYDEIDQMRGLLHDATEAYMIDVPRPLKIDPMMAGYRSAEAHLEVIIAMKFGFAPGFMTPPVQKYDRILLATEARDLMGNPTDWGPIIDEVTPRANSLVGGSGDPDFWRQAFLERFEQLQANISGEAGA